MKRISAIGLFLISMLGFALNASALSVTFNWETPGTVKIQRESQVGPWVDLTATQTSYTVTTSGWIYLYGADGYRVTGAQSTDGETVKASMNNNGSYVGFYVGNSYDGKVYNLSVEKVERNDTFSIDVVNGAEFVTAKFNSGYILDLQNGTHTYNIDAGYDKVLTLTLKDIASAYMVKLNGTEIEKNRFYPRYEDINIAPGDELYIQVLEGAEPQDCTVTFEYGAEMEGCLYNILNRSTGVFVEPDKLTDNSLVVKENTELRVNFVPDDYTITKLLLNGEDVTSKYSNNCYIFTVTDPATILRIEGTAKVYGDVNFTGYIVNGDQVNFSMTYQGTPFAIPEGTEVTTDIKIDDSFTMPAGETKKYIIPVSEKKGKFFFSPKEGYYISNVYTRTPEGSLEQHSGSASISANIDGTTFYMMVEKLPEAYTANMTVTGKDFNLRITSSTSISDSWCNPSSPSYSTAEGEREISFIPGYGTPIVFGFIGDEAQRPALYLDGAEQTATVNSDSGAIEYYITPYSPSDDSQVAPGVHSTIDVYNSFTVRPQLSGASLVTEDDVQAEFFYSPVMHEATPAGQVVISGTQFTVRPASSDLVVTYKDNVVQLDDKGEFVFYATGNARNNVVKVSRAPAGVADICGDDNGNVTVYSLDGRVVLDKVPAEQLSGLEKGFYIINGKKTMIK